MHPSTIEYHHDTIKKFVRLCDRQDVAIQTGDRETVARIGRRLYSNDKAMKHRAYSSAAALDRYVLDGYFAGVGVRNVDDLRLVLYRTQRVHDLGRKNYRGPLTYRAA